MLCAVIKGPTLEDAHEQIIKALQYTSMVELRLDCFSDLNFESLKQLRRENSHATMIFTLRSQLHGGGYAKDNHERLSDLLHLAEIGPEYIDLDDDVPSEFITLLETQYPKVMRIVSYHDFTGLTTDLDALYRGMKKKSAHLYKIAVTPKNSVEALQLLCWGKKNDSRLIVVGMGEYGQCTRILGSVIIHTPITYAAIDEDQIAAPGQLTAKVLSERYHYHQLNKQTQCFGLIGDPVSKSLSDVTHNKLMEENDLNAVYVKMQVRSEELKDFLQLAKQLPFRGLSVTMPLKEEVIPYLDSIDSKAEEIGAVNTLSFNDGRICGYNTDCLGALDALERESKVKGKRVVILGAGGAAKAIAFEAVCRGASVVILNRDVEKARKIAQRLGCEARGLDAMSQCAQEGYDVLINCTPLAMPISPNDMLSRKIVMDIVTRPKETDFLKHALKKDCKVVYGQEMFIAQAIEQYRIWFNQQLDVEGYRQTMNNQISDNPAR